MPVHILWSEVLGLMEKQSIRSREVLAKKAGISSATLYNIHAKGMSPSWKALEGLCQALNCQPGEILQHVDKISYIKREKPQRLFVKTGGQTRS